MRSLSQIIDHREPELLAQLWVIPDQIIRELQEHPERFNDCIPFIDALDRMQKNYEAALDRNDQDSLDPFKNP